MRVGFYQYAPRFGEIEQNLDAVISHLDSIDCDLLVLPELAMSGYQFCSLEEVAKLSEPVPDGSTTRRLTMLAKNGTVTLWQDCQRCTRGNITILRS